LNTTAQLELGLGLVNRSRSAEARQKRDELFTKGTIVASTTGPGGGHLGAADGPNKERELRTSKIGVAVGAGLVALLFGTLAPLAHAASPTDVEVCTTSDDPVAADGGKGIVVSFLTESPADVVCSYTSSGARTTYAVASSNIWTLTIERTVNGVTQIIAVADNNDPPAGEVPVKAGDLVVLRATPACDPAAGCGTIIDAIVGE
jgi:hypothetical protein